MSTYTRNRITFAIVAVGLALGPLMSSPSQAVSFKQTNLASDIPGRAANTDASLKNPWGIAFGPTSPFWISNQVTGNSTLYDGTGAPQPLVVSIPGGGPTGAAFNSTADFPLTTGGKAVFLFATLSGNIAGWNGAHGTTAEIAANTPGAIYTGLALGNNGSGNFLYAADAGGIDVFNASFTSTTLAGSFVDPNLPAGFTPYNIANIGGTLFVTYENEDDGGGVINRFDTNGNFLSRFASNAAGGPLDSPWGVAVALASFGDFGNAILVGNEDDGHISAYDTSGNFLGQLLKHDGTPIANTGQWGLAFGTGGTGFDPNSLYFAAGIEDEAHGLFGRIEVVPEPSAFMITMEGLLLTVLSIDRRSSR